MSFFLIWSLFKTKLKLIISKTLTLTLTEQHNKDVFYCYNNDAFDHFSKLNGHAESDDQFDTTSGQFNSRVREREGTSDNASVPPALHRGTAQPAFNAAHSPAARVHSSDITSLMYFASVL